MASNNKLVFIIIIGLLLVLGIVSYDKSDFTNTSEAIAAPAIIKKPANSFNKKKIPQKILTLNTKPTYTSAQGNIIENLHGRFLGDRAEFYIIKNPKNKIHDSPITSVSLVYLDAYLYKSKYILTNNIVLELIKQHGAFTISGYDFINRDIIADEKLLIKNNGMDYLNSKLNNYLLRWDIGDSEIIYRVNSTIGLYEYTKRRKDYKITFWSIEHSN